jgi:hypothetical protein
MKRDTEGVAAVVGTIMALMVFLAFMSLVVTQYVPVMMTDNEATHMSEVLNQFGNIKQNIDNLIITDNRDIAMYSTVTLGAKGVPVFASETMGMLSLIRTKSTGVITTNAGEFNVSVYDATGTTIDWSAPHANTSGVIRLYAPNRYYVQQKIVYENGAVIVWQPDGVNIKALPHFHILKQTTDSITTVNMSFTLVHLYGEPKTISGTWNEGVHTKLLYTDSQFQSFGTSPRKVEIKLISDYYIGWKSYFSKVLSKGGLILSVDYTLTTDDTAKECILTLNSVNNIGLKVANVWAGIGDVTPP